MSVIGRLDDQVNAVLIAPLTEKGARRDEAFEADEAKNCNASMDEDALPSVQTTDSTTSAPMRHKGQEQEALPVWLL